MIRQIDTGIGIIVGSYIGWFHHEWYVWLLLFIVLVVWGLVENKNKEGGKE